MLLTCVVLGMLAQVAPHGEGAICADQRAVARSYVALRFRFDGANERRLALSDDGLRKVSWDGLDRFFPGASFYYLFQSFERKRFSLLAVTRDCEVLEMEDAKSLEPLLARGGWAITSEAEARRFAFLLLKMANVSGVYGGGYSDGVGMIESNNDIAFRSVEERRALEKLVQIKPPSIELRDGGLCFHFYSWERKTSMEVLENTLECDRYGRVSLKWNVLMHDVGRRE